MTSGSTCSTTGEGPEGSETRERRRVVEWSAVEEDGAIVVAVFLGRNGATTIENDATVLRLLVRNNSTESGRVTIMVMYMQ
jgi:hypothetical protein